MNTTMYNVHPYFSLKNLGKRAHYTQQNISSLDLPGDVPDTLYWSWTLNLGSVHSNVRVSDGICKANLQSRTAGRCDTRGTDGGGRRD